MPLPIRAIHQQFDPRRLPNCVAWFDAADTTTLFTGSGGTGAISDGATVGYWKNKSSSNHATQATLNNRPRWDQSVRNGLPCLYFDGNNDALTLASSLQPINSGALSVFFAGKQDDVLSSNRGTILTDRLTTPYQSFEFLGSTTRVIMSDGVDGISNHFVDSAIIDLTASWFVSCIVSVVGSRGRLSINNVSRTVNSGTGTTKTGSAGATIGSRSSGFTALWRGYFAELIVYSSDVGKTEETLVQQYLMAKWGVA